MKSGNATLILFSCMIYNACIKSLSSEFIRIKRWDNGHNPTSDLSNMFRGTAGVDYPDFKTVPNTNFRCQEQIYEGGLYADVEASCQVYHVCHDGRKDSFLCGRGTIFNQQILACDYWYSTECDSAPNYYHLNSQISENSDSPKNSQHDYSQDGGNNPNFQNVGSNPGLSNSGGNNPNFQNVGSNPGLSNSGGNNPNFQNGGRNPGLSNSGGNNPNFQNGGRNPGLSNSGGSNPNFQNVGSNPGLPNSGGNTDYYNGQPQCHCLKTSLKVPWSFPGGRMHGSDK